MNSSPSNSSGGGSDESSDSDVDDVVENETRQVLLYAIGQLCDTEATERTRRNAEFGDTVSPCPRATRATLAVMTELALQQLKGLTKDIAAFARHANRKSVKVEDVLLVARRNASLQKTMTQFAQEHLASFKKRKRESDRMT